MKIVLNRIKDDGGSTLGSLSIDGEVVGFTLEDTFNEPKIYGQTRIPYGVYEIKLRHGTPMDKRYSKKY